MSFVEIFLPFRGNPFSPLGDLWRIPLGPPPTPSWPFAVLRGPSWKSFLPLATFGGSLLSLLQPLRGPSPFFVVLRGNLFAFSWKSFLSPWRPLADPSRASSNPFVALCRSSWPFVDILLPFPGNPSPYPTFGRPLSSLRQPLRGPSPFFVALRGNLFTFSWKSFLPLATSGGSLSSLRQPLRGPLPFFVALRGYLFTFSWKSFLPLATFGGSLSSLLQPLRGPSSFFVALRG